MECDLSEVDSFQIEQSQPVLVELLVDQRMAAGLAVGLPEIRLR